YFYRRTTLHKFFGISLRVTSPFSLAHFILLSRGRQRRGSPAARPNAESGFNGVLLSRTRAFKERATWFFGIQTHQSFVLNLLSRLSRSMRQNLMVRRFIWRLNARPLFVHIPLVISGLV